jgi:uncharacterized membrane protein HdeD (DUF308 family)
MAMPQADALLPKKVATELWWFILLQSLLAIFFGIAAIFWPGLTLITLVYLFSAFVLTWGIIEIVHALMSIQQRDTWWLTLVFGLVSLVVGVYLIRHPAVSFATFILLTGLTLIIRGLFDIVGVFLDRNEITAPHRILLIITGVAAIVAGAILLLQPVAGGVAFVWVLGLYALIFGTLTMVIALERRNELLKGA